MDEDDDMADDDQYKHAIKWGNQLIEEAIEDIQNMKYLEEKKSKRKTKENKKTKRYDEAVENAKKLIKELEKKSYEEIDQDLLKRNGFEIYTKNYTSGMVQSWNRFCFTGGLLEIDLKLPGKAREGGEIYFIIFNFSNTIFYNFDPFFFFNSRTLASRLAYG